MKSGGSWGGVPRELRFLSLPRLVLNSIYIKAIKARNLNTKACKLSTQVQVPSLKRVGKGRVYLETRDLIQYCASGRVLTKASELV
jgi:hypothetical protein